MKRTLWEKRENPNQFSEDQNKTNMASFEKTNQPDINFLLDGTHSYTIKLHKTNGFWEQELLTANEIQSKIEETLEKINQQWGKLIQILELTVKWKKDEFDENYLTEKVYSFIINKENPFEDPLRI